MGRVKVQRGLPAAVRVIAAGMPRGPMFLLRDFGVQFQERRPRFGVRVRSTNWVIHPVRRRRVRPSKTTCWKWYRSWDTLPGVRNGRRKTDSSYGKLCWEFGILPNDPQVLVCISKLVSDWRTVDDKRRRDCGRNNAVFRIGPKRSSRDILCPLENPRPVPNVTFSVRLGGAEPNLNIIG